MRGLRRFFPRRLPYVYRQGLANLYRPANQTLMVVLALGFGVFLLGTLVLVQHNLLRELRVDRGAARPNLVFFDVQPDQQDDVEARVAAVGPLTAPVVPIVPMRIQSLEGPARRGAARDRGRDEAPGALGAAARVPQQLPRRAGGLGARRRGRLVAARRVEGPRATARCRSRSRRASRAS